MYNVIIYEDKKQRSEIKEYINNLRKENSKDSKIKFNKIVSYIRMLSRERIKFRKAIYKTHKK